MAAQSCGGQFVSCAVVPCPPNSATVWTVQGVLSIASVGTPLLQQSASGNLVGIPLRLESTSPVRKGSRALSEQFAAVQAHPSQEGQESELPGAQDTSASPDEPARVAEGQPGVDMQPGATEATSLKTFRPHFPRPRLTIERSSCFADEAVHSEYKVLAVSRRKSTWRIIKAIRLSVNKKVALKSILTKDAEILQAAQAEFRTLQGLQHANVVKALELKMASGEMIMVMEDVHGAALQTLMRRQASHFSEANSRRYAAHLFRAVSHLHENGVMHRDITPAHVLVSLESEKLVLVGFRSARNYYSDMHALSPVGTKLYMAPEVVLGHPPTLASDVWSAALCVFLMLSARLPQGRDRRSSNGVALEEAAKQHVTLQGQCWDKVSMPCKEFLAPCLALDASARPTARCALEGPWLGDFTDDAHVD